MILEFFKSDAFLIFLAWLISTFLFAKLIVYISVHPQKRTLPLKIAFIVMFLGGTFIYCACHYLEIQQFLSGNNPRPAPYLEWTKDSDYAWVLYVPYVIERAVIDVGMMFYGRSNASVFYNLNISRNPLIVFLFWLIHIIAFYTAASALLIRFGNELLRWIRIVSSKISDVDLIFGINSDSLVFGRNLADVKGNILIYVDDKGGEEFESAICDIGGLIYSDNDAVKATVSFLKSIRIKPHKTKFRLYALSNDYDRNLQYAQRMLESLKELGISPEQTELMLLGSEEWKGMKFQSSDSQYGYGTVASFDEFEMSARLLVHQYPPCKAIKFDDNGRATENFNALLIGFGQIGHEVLRKIIANGQFEGSDFHATIFDPNFESRTGFFNFQYPNMFANYNIDFEPQSGRSNKIFKFIQNNAANLKYIVVCLKNRDTARDIAVHIVDRLQTMGYHLSVYTCDSKSIRCYSQNTKECETYWLYDSELLYSGKFDQYAMELNHRYCGGKNRYEDWKQCAYFDRMSSRASVDYLIPLISLVKNNQSALTPEQRENLAKCEHLRWCAFHYIFGFDVMDKEEFTERIKAYLQEIKEFGKSKIKITKDKQALKHVCLVDWDELDEISRIENSLTGKNKNYKDSDRSNIDMVEELIKMEG